MVDQWPFWARCAFVALCGTGFLVMLFCAEALLLALDSWHTEHQRRKVHNAGSIKADRSRFVVGRGGNAGRRSGGHRGR